MIFVNNGLNGMVLIDGEQYARMKNCVNCEHSEVCLVVAKRRATHANDYTACSKWKLTDGDGK